MATTISASPEIDQTEGDTMTPEGTNVMTSPPISSVTSQETTSMTSLDSTTITTRLPTTVSDTTSPTESTAATVPPTTTFSDTTTHFTTDSTSLDTTTVLTTTPDKWPTTTGSDVMTTALPSGGDGLSQGAIIGIAVGASAGCLLIIIIIAVCCRKRHNRSQNYIDGDENPNDYVVHMNPTDRARESTGPASPVSHYAVPFTPDDHHPIAAVNAFNNPMYAQGMATADDHVIPPSNEVEVRKNGLSKEDRALQAASRASMGPILLGEDVTYDQMYKTTGTFKGLD